MNREENLTGILAQYGAELRFEDLPDEVVEHAKLLILDTVGVGLWGSTLAWGDMVARLVRDFGSAQEASLWGTSYRASPPDAALANGTFCHGFELDDIHKNALIHAGAVTVVPTLAVAHERYVGKAVSGSEFITAVVAGCEIGARVGLISGLPQLKQGFHAAAMTGVFCSSAAVARALKVPAEQFIHALSLGASQAAGLMAAQHGAMVKRMHLGRSAQSGVYAGLLAQRGFTGIDNVLDAPYGGYLSAFGLNADIPAVKKSLRKDHETLNIGFKPYSSCAGTHTSIDAVLHLMRQHPEIHHDTVERVDITMATVNKDHVGWRYEPAGLTAAQMNLGYCVAVALRHGNVFVESFTPQAINDKDAVALAHRVVTHTSGDYDQMGLEGRYAVHVQITLKNGQLFSAERTHAKGSYKHPLSKQEVVTKFERLAASVFPKERVDAIFRLTDQLQDAENVGDLDTMLSKKLL